MLKWFREYGKWILVVGTALLMVVFLLEGALSTFQRGAGDEAVGSIRGQEITRVKQHEAAADLDIIRGVEPTLGLLAQHDPLAWLLMLHEAQQLGLSASEHEVDLLIAVLPDGQANVQKLADRLGLRVADVRHALRNWLIVQQYKELIYGLGHLRVEERLQELFQFAQSLQQMFMYVQMGLIQDPQVLRLLEDPERLLAPLRGVPRVSEVLTKRVLADQRAAVKVSAVLVSSERYLDQVQELDEQKVRDLYEEHKDRQAGVPDEEGFTFGYRQPHRVRLEYLALPLERVRARVQVSESEAVRYYDQHLDEFTVEEPAPAPPEATQPADAPPEEGATTQPAPTQKRVQPYLEVRQRVVSRLRDQKATELAEQIVREARAVLLNQARGLRESGGYRVIPENWRPLPLEDVAQALQQKFGVLPDVVRRDDQWLDRQELSRLPELGASWLEGQMPAPFVEYVHSTRELEPPGDHPLLTARLQQGLPSLPLSGTDRSRYIFRLTAVQKEHTPEFEAVAAQVRQDARQLAAYELLLQDRPRWEERLKAERLEDVASQMDQPLLQPDAFPRRVQTPAGLLAAPEIEGIGRSDGFVDAAFAVAEGLMSNGGVASATPEQRSGTAPLPGKLSLALFRLEEYDAITHSQYRQVAQMPQLPALVSQSLARTDAEDPLSLEALAERVGFVWPDGTKPTKEDREQRE